MKNKSFTPIAAGFAFLLASPVFAIEAPADDAPAPPAAEAELEIKPADEKPAQEAKAYLGVESAQVPDMLAEHLGLKPGEGVFIRSVMPDGPAAKAGLQANDVLLRIGGAAVGNGVDLTREVTSHKPGDALRVELIQKGKPVEMDVTLGTRPVDFAGAGKQPLEQLNLDALPKDMADRVRGMIEGNLGGLELDIQGGAVEIAPQMDEAMREMKKRMEKAVEGLNAQIIPGMPKVDVQQGATMRLLDQKGSVEFKSNEDGKEVTVRDKENNITWTGPWDTEQDKAAAPDDVRERVDRLNLDMNFKGKGLRFKFNQDELKPEEAE
jgi:serine protease Do